MGCSEISQNVDKNEAEGVYAGERTQTKIWPEKERPKKKAAHNSKLISITFN
jgi:hypothetical protein